MTIIVGRGRSKATQRIEINDPTVSREHCWLSDNGDGTYTLQNKSQQGTFVDGRQVLKTNVRPETELTLGSFKVKVADLLPLQPQSSPSPTPVSNPAPTPTPKPTPKPEPPTFSLRPLETIWNNYDRQRLEIQEESAKRANQQRVQGIVSMLGMALGLLPIPVVFRAICVLASLFLGIYFFMQGQSTTSVQRQLHDLDEEYASKYKCPNPACGRPLGNMAYRNVRYQKQCPACSCKYCD
ncbi:MAG: FHA domain-containing protein [Bacteroidaceae bacterium]|nr:FHA domain-containing protein [Bacteroidaceae bacterium]